MSDTSATGGAEVKRVAPPPATTNTTERTSLAQKALTEGYARLRYRDTSLLIWQQQQTELHSSPPANYLSRSQSAWYSSNGNDAVVVRHRRTLGGGGHTESSHSRICLVM